MSIRSRVSSATGRVQANPEVSYCAALAPPIETNNCVERPKSMNGSKYGTKRITQPTTRCCVLFGIEGLIGDLTSG